MPRTRKTITDTDRLQKAQARAAAELARAEAIRRVQSVDITSEREAVEQASATLERAVAAQRRANEHVSAARVALIAAEALVRSQLAPLVTAGVSAELVAALHGVPARLAQTSGGTEPTEDVEAEPTVEDDAGYPLGVVQ